MDPNPETKIRKDKLFKVCELFQFVNFLASCYKSGKWE